MDIEDGDDEGEAPDSDEEKENQRAARIKEAQKEKEEEEEDNMPRAQVAYSDFAITNCQTYSEPNANAHMHVMSSALLSRISIPRCISIDRSEDKHSTYS